MSSLSDFKVNACQEADLIRVIDFFKKMQNSTLYFLPEEKNDIVKKYRKYKDGSEGLSLFLLKDKNKNIIGCSGYVPFKGILCGQAIDGFIGSDAIIDANERKQFPLLAMLLAHCYENLVRKEKLFPLVCPANKEVSKSFESVQWQDFCRIWRLTSDFAVKMIPKLVFSGIEFKQIKHFDKDFKSFFEKIKEEHHFLLNTDISFLNWKYFSDSSAKNVVLAAFKKKKISGYIIAEKRYGDIHIIDITVDLKYPSTILYLLFKSLDYFEIKELTPIVCCLSHKSYIDILMRAGFIQNWRIDCLFFKVGLLFSKIKSGNFYSSNKDLYHFNGFAQHLY